MAYPVYVISIMAVLLSSNAYLPALAFLISITHWADATGISYYAIWVAVVALCRTYASFLAYVST